MKTRQLHDQRLRPAQETGNEKAEPLLSIRQTPIDHPMDSMIDSLGLVMDNGISPVGSIEDIFTRLTQRLVFEFLGGHARMEELPCLGDLADGNYKFHRITPSPTISKSSQFKFLDSTGNLHLSSIVFIDSDYNPRIVDYLCESVLLDSFDASSTTFISSLEHFRSKLISQSADHTTEESHQCSPLDSFMIPETISGLMAESLCDSEVSATQVFMKIDLMCAPIPISSNQSDKEYSETSVSKMAYSKDGSNIFDLVKGEPSEIHNASVNASNEISAHFAQSLYPLMFNNRRGSVTIESSSLTTIINVQTSNNSTSDCDSVSSTDCNHLEHSCNDEFGDSNKLLATISMDDSSSKFSIPDPKHLNAFLYGTLKIPMFLASELPDGKLDTFDYPSLYEDSDLVDSTDVAYLSGKKFNNQFGDGVSEYDKKTSDTPSISLILEDGSSRGEYKEMEVSVTPKVSDPCYTESLDTHWPTLVNLSSFDVSDHEELLESYGFNNQDQTIDIGYTCASPSWPEKVDAAWKEAIQMNLTDLASNEDSLSSFYDGNSKTSVSSTHLEQRKCASQTSSLVDSSEGYLSQEHPCNNGFQNSIEEPISGNAENPLVYAIPNPNLLDDYLYGNLKSPMFLASERMDTNFDRHDSLSFYGALDDCEDVASSSDNCNVELLDSDCSSKDPSAFLFDYSDHYELLETYGLNIQEQYTDTDCTCASPTWPEKMITVSKEQTQRPLTCSIPNLTKDDCANGLLTADSSLFHSNTDETSVMNKNWTDETYERNSENSVSLCYLNQLECAFETSRIDAGLMDCLPLLHSCSDDFGDSIEHQSLENDENEWKFANPDPRVLKDFFYGSLDSPHFLASELLDGKIDTLDYPSLFGDCGKGDRTEGADLSDKMIFNQCTDVRPGMNDSSINKFSCSIQLLDVSSSSFDISDHDKLLERYGIDKQDQFMDGNWICNSPTWPEKI